MIRIVQRVLACFFISLIIVIVGLSSSISADTILHKKNEDTQTNNQGAYFHELAQATYQSILAMVEPSTGLPHDHFALLFDVMPQFATRCPYTNAASGASLKAWFCNTNDCRDGGYYGLKLEYNTPPGTWCSYNVDMPSFDVNQATYLEAWVKGATGGERFEFVLWSDCQGSFPGRPESAVISAEKTWKRCRIPLSDFQPYTDLSSLCRLSIGFNDALHPGGTIYLDKIAFVDSDGNLIHVPADEMTSVTNIGLYIASLLGALDLGLESYGEALTKLTATLTTIETLEKWHGFPQCWNHVVSLRPSSTDLCISTVDLGNLAASLILLRQRIPELSARVSTLLEAMDWSWLYDTDEGLLYGCRYPNGSASDWHYDWIAADSRLAYFIGIGTGKIPPGSWNNLDRSKEPQRCANLWHFEPGWDGGGLFMQFLPGIFLEELEEAGNKLGESACNFSKDQICYAQQIGAPAWGWSATTLPNCEYCGYGCERDDIVVPHGSILSIDCVDSDALISNLHTLETLGGRPQASDGTQMFDFGFCSSVNWQTGEVSSVYLLLDQSMAFLSLVNYLTNGHLRAVFCKDKIAEMGIDLISDYVRIPIPYVKVNGSDGPITLNPSDILTLTVSLNNYCITDNADWWLAADTPFGFYFYTVEGWTTDLVAVYQGPLFYLDSFELFGVPASGLPAGIYTIYFGIDTNMDGDVTWDSLYCDSVVADITNE